MYILYIYIYIHMYKYIYIYLYIYICYCSTCSFHDSHLNMAPADTYRHTRSRHIECLQSCMRLILCLLFIRQHNVLFFLSLLIALHTRGIVFDPLHLACFLPLPPGDRCDSDGIMIDDDEYEKKILMEIVARTIRIWFPNGSRGFCQSLTYSRFLLLFDSLTHLLLN